MSLDALIMFTGAFVAVLPFLGFPPGWKSVLFFLAGILVVGLGIVVRRRGNSWTPLRKSVPQPAEDPAISTEDEGAMMGN